MDISYLNDNDKEVIKKLVDKINYYHMEAPAILFLESYKPLSFIGSQAMQVLSPVVNIIYSTGLYDSIMKILEKRDGVEYIIREIEKSTGSAQ
ncbi:MAG: hypothetical protein WC002_07280 [Candidatus Muiribacteriota bacterium]|jgi:hypothetical protein